MKIERATFKQLIALMKEYEMDSDKALEAAEKICEIFEALEVEVKPAQKPTGGDLPLVGKPPLTPEEFKAKRAEAAQKIADGTLPSNAPPATGKPGTRVPGGYYGRDGRFVPEMKPVTAAFNSEVTPIAPA